MIPRYTSPAVAAIWDEKYQLWLRIETVAAEVLVGRGIIPEATVKSLKKAKVKPQRIDELEAELNHDVIAFLTHLAEQMGEEAAFIHYGMTSSDLLDTCLALQLSRSAEELDKSLTELISALKTLADKHKRTPCIGRSHGIFAEPTSFGLKMLYAAAEFARHRRRLAAAKEEVAVCQLSGAVGTHAHLSPEIEADFAARLGLAAEAISSQVVPRDRHAVFFSTLAVIASSVERLAVEIRHLARSEVGEVSEEFTAEQKGSSAMPHKKNPISAENITGLARLVRACYLPFMENVALWHERDISHSSVERVAAPDAVGYLDFALKRAAGLIKRLEVKPQAMKANLQKAKGLYASQGVLLALVRSGVSREKGYRLVQKAAMAARDGDDFRRRLRACKEVEKALSEKEMAKLFDPSHYLRFSDEIFRRVGKLT